MFVGWNRACVPVPVGIAAALAITPRLYLYLHRAHLPAPFHLLPLALLPCNLPGGLHCLLPTLSVTLCTFAFIATAAATTAPAATTAQTAPLPVATPAIVATTQLRQPLQWQL